MDISIITFHSCGGQQAIVNNGLQITWFNVWYHTQGTGLLTINFPISFTTFCEPVMAVDSVYQDSSTPYHLGVMNVDLTSLQCYLDGNMAGKHFVVIGH